MILSFNPERIDSNYVKLIQAPWVLYYRGNNRRKELHPTYGERPAHQDVLVIKNDNLDIDTILEYHKDKRTYK